MHVPDAAAIADRFGSNWHQKPLFYSNEFALRFDLGPGGFWIDRFLTASHRAGTVARSLLQDCPDLTLAIIRFGDEAAGSSRSFQDSLDAYGLPERDRFIAHMRPSSDPDGPSVWEYVASLTKQNICRAVWSAVAGELGYMPLSPGLVYLLSVELGVICHSYDDRGMDVVGVEPDRLRALYTEHKSWLLDHDLPRMERTFG